MNKQSLKEHLSSHRKKILDEKREEQKQKEIQSANLVKQQLEALNFPLGSVLVEDLTKMFKTTIEQNPHLRILRVNIPLPRQIKPCKYVKELLEKDSKCSVEFLVKNSEPFASFSIEVF